MIKRDALVSLLDSWLEPEKIKDNTINSLQFEGKNDVINIGCAVDVSLDTLNLAAQKNIDFLITHHGMIWGGLKKITDIEKKRMEILFTHNINLYCSHLPLDKHPSLGNNISIMNLLNLKNTQEIFFDVGYIGEYEKPISYNNLIIKIKETISNKLIEMPFGSQNIQRIAVCSGGAASNLNAIFEAYAKNADTILSGETNSIMYHYAKELKLNIICAGHYATEVFGVQSLGKKIITLYPTCHYEFLDLPTGF